MIFGLGDQGRSCSKAQNKTRTNIFFIYNRSENGIPLNKYSSTTGQLNLSGKYLVWKLEWKGRRRKNLGEGKTKTSLLRINANSRLTKKCCVKILCLLPKLSSASYALSDICHLAPHWNFLTAQFFTSSKSLITLDFIFLMEIWHSFKQYHCWKSMWTL